MDTQIQTPVAEIFRSLCGSAVPQGPGAVTWLAPDGEGTAHRRPAPLGPHLYDGSAGVAVFMAAYYLATGDPVSRDLALGAVGRLRATLSLLARTPARPRSLAIGGLVGLGSFVYTFLLLARWLGRAEILDSARHAAALLTPERVVADVRLDVVGGAAGALLAVLRLEREESLPGDERSRALDLARACGEHLMAHRGAWSSRARAGRPALSGFAHGAAGISYALMKLFERTGGPALRDAALEGFAFERSLHDRRTGTWLDPRSGRPVEQAAWCHGAPGIALGRAGSVDALRDPEVRDDMEQALSVTEALPDVPRDHLCCGNIGRVEILNTAGRLLGRPELVRQARALAGRVLQRAADRGLSLDASLSSLFRGAAGVGYSLLRLARPDRLPCLLLLE
jgi:lantibiotic modifying enzyme